jgi:hypothetical protein
VLPGHTIDELFEMRSKEKELENQINTIGQQIIVLEAACKAKKEEQIRVKERKESIFEGLLSTWLDRADERRKLG